MATQDLPLLVEELEGGLHNRIRKGSSGRHYSIAVGITYLVMGRSCEMGEEILIWSNPATAPVT